MDDVILKGKKCAILQNQKSRFYALYKISKYKSGRQNTKKQQKLENVVHPQITVATSFETPCFFNY